MKSSPSQEGCFSGGSLPDIWEKQPLKLCHKGGLGLLESRPYCVSGFSEFNMEKCMWIFFLALMFIAAIGGKIVSPDCINWRAIDIATTMLGSIAIITAIAEWRRLMPANKIQSLQNRVATHLMTLSFVSSRHLSIVRFRIENKQSNLQQYIATAPWFEAVVEFARENSISNEKHSISSLPQFSENIDDPEISELKTEIDSALDGYQSCLEEFRNTKKQLERTSLEDIGIFLMPTLISLAVSLSLFKAIYQP